MGTIKISDLSVGDWVKVILNKCDYAEPDTFKAKVLTVVNNSVGVGYDNSGIVMSALVEDLQPIPITAEILKKNGWTSDEMCAEIKITEYSHLEYHFREHRLREWVCRETGWLPGEIVTSITFSAHCYSVHQLQHALRLTGIDEEINL